MSTKTPYPNPYPYDFSCAWHKAGQGKSETEESFAEIWGILQGLAERDGRARRDTCTADGANVCRGPSKAVLHCQTCKLTCGFKQLWVFVRCTRFLTPVGDWSELASLGSGLECYWVGSLDFHFFGNNGGFH